SVPALVKLLEAEEPNMRARALWLLDRIGGAAREHVVAQLKSGDAAFRALGVRILRRHSAEYADAILPLGDDSADEVKREVLLAIRTIPGDKAMDVLERIAATYDGSDRYQLEAINIAANDRKHELLERLDRRGFFQGLIAPGGRFPLLEVLDPKRAA